MRVGVDSDSLWKLLFFYYFFLFLKSFFVCASVSLGKRKFRFSKVKTEHSLPIPLFSVWVSKSNSFPFPPDFYREEVCACLTASKSLCNPTSSYKQGAVKHKSDWAMMNVKGEVTIFFFFFTAIKFKYSKKKANTAKLSAWEQGASKVHKQGMNG